MEKKIPFKPKYTQFSKLYFNKHSKIECLLLSVGVVAEKEDGWKIFPTGNKNLVCKFKFLVPRFDHVCLMTVIVPEPEISNFTSFMFPL